MSNNKSSEEWDLEIKPVSGLFQLDLKEVWKYKDLLFLFVKRDITTVYKQTVLGPLWFILQPLLTTLTFVIIFGNIAKLSTDGVPQVLFYLAGITTWNYFSESFTGTSRTFIENSGIFGKVYFPRLILPLSKITAGLMKFLIQFALFLGFFFYFYSTTNLLHPNWTIILMPLYISIMAVLGLGFGLIFSSLTTKYRDLTFLLTFGVQLLMYATPVIYPLSQIKSELFLTLIKANPMTAIVEGVKYAFLGSGQFDIYLLCYSIFVSTFVFFVGIIIFNRVEKSFTDTV